MKTSANTYITKNIISNPQNRAENELQKLSNNTESDLKNLNKRKGRKIRPNLRRRTKRTKPTLVSVCRSDVASRIKPTTEMDTKKKSNMFQCISELMKK
mmetsp:Transcript_49315/g.90642  ORF Transcript_49315/g.90642 Transcript_49315/m.90642 type:complete len:99 (-) Transcript_49315:93-389(-)